MIDFLRRLLLRDPHLRELMAGGAISMAIRVLAGVVAFLVNVVVARLLGVEAAGVYFLALTVITIAAAFSKLGLDSAMTRLVAESARDEDWGSINAVYRFSVCTVALVSSIVSIAVVAGSDWLSIHVFAQLALAPVLSIMGFSILPISLYMLHSNLFQGLRDMARYQVFQNLGVSSAFLVGVGLFFLTNRVVHSAILAAEIFVGASIAVVAAAFASWNILPWTRFLDGHYDHRRVMRIAWPLFGITGLQLTSTWMGQLTLGMWRSSEEVALFTAAARTSMLLLIVLMAVNSIAFPKFAAMYSAGDFVAIKRLSLWSTRIMVVACIPMFAFVLWYSDAIMGIFGSDFVAASTALNVLAAGQFVNVATGSVIGLLTMTGHERYALGASVVGAALMAALCFFLVPEYGVIGAAYAQAISLCTQLFLNTWAVRRVLGFMPLNIFDRA